MLCCKEQGSLNSWHWPMYMELLLALFVQCQCFIFFRESGIAYALISSALSITLVSYLYARKIKTVKINQTIKESFIIGLPTVKLGFMMALSNISVFFVQFIDIILIIR